MACHIPLTRAAQRSAPPLQGKRTANPQGRCLKVRQGQQGLVTTPAALLAPSRQPHGFSKPHTVQQHQLEIKLQQGAQGFVAKNVSRVLVGLGLRFLKYLLGGSALHVRM